MNNNPHETTWDKIVNSYIYVPGVLLIAFITATIITAVSGGDHFFASVLCVLFVISILPIILVSAFYILKGLVLLLLKKDFWICIILNALIMIGIPAAIVGIVYLIINLTV